MLFVFGYLEEVVEVKCFYVGLWEKSQVLNLMIYIPPPPNQSPYSLTSH